MRVASSHVETRRESSFQSSISVCVANIVAVMRETAPDDRSEDADASHRADVEQRRPVGGKLQNALVALEQDVVEEWVQENDNQDESGENDRREKEDKDTDDGAQNPAVVAPASLVGVR